MLARRERLPSREALVRAAVAGVLWFGAYMVSLNAAERWVDAGTSSLLVNTGPLFIALLAGWLLHEGFPRALLAGCLVALAGAGLIALSVSGHGSHELLGAGLCIVAALAYALAIVIQKPALRVTGALPITFSACTAGAPGAARVRPSERARAGARLTGNASGGSLPGHRPDRGCVPPLGLRALEDERRPPRRDDVCRSAPGGVDQLDCARPGSAGAGDTGRPAVSRRCRDRASRLTRRCAVQPASGALERGERRPPATEAISAILFDTQRVQTSIRLSVIHGSSEDMHRRTLVVG